MNGIPVDMYSKKRERPLCNYGRCGRGRGRLLGEALWHSPGRANSVSAFSYLRNPAAYLINARIISDCVRSGSFLPFSSFKSIPCNSSCNVSKYRSLLLHGERHMALETLKTLMVSRPLVCIGFGLKDPDFLYIRDILSNIYQAGSFVRHFSIPISISLS